MGLLYSHLSRCILTSQEDALCVDPVELVKGVFISSPYGLLLACISMDPGIIDESALSSLRSAFMVDRRMGSTNTSSRPYSSTVRRTSLAISSALVTSVLMNVASIRP